MRYYRYIYQLSEHAVPITDMVKISISVADILADLIIGTPLVLVLHFTIVHPIIIILYSK